MSSCDEDILLLEVSPQQAVAAATAAAAASAARKEWATPASPRAAAAVAAAAAGRDEFSDEDARAAVVGVRPPAAPPLLAHLGAGIKRPQLEIGGDFAGASSEGSEREPEMSDDVKGPKRLKVHQQSQQSQPSQQPASGGDAFKKDREEWSDSAICALLDAYTEKFMQLNKGNLRGRHWQEVSDTVSLRCQGQKSAKTIEQCKNKVDSLKKRHKVERQRMEANGTSSSQWPWFTKVEQIVGSAPKLSVLLDDDSNHSLLIKSDKQQQQQQHHQQHRSATRQRRPSNSRTPTTSLSPGAANSLGFHGKCKMIQPRWQRVLLKVSGEALAGDRVQNVDPKITMGIAKEVLSAVRLGIEVAVVVGGGNFFRGINWAGASGLDRSSADHIGMMATMMNAVILQAAFEDVGIKTRVQTAYSMPAIAEPCMSKKAIQHLEKGRVVIFGGGTGNPYYTTDTAAAIRAAEIKAEIIAKATISDGIFYCDKFLEHVSFRELVMKGLTALDAEAMNQCEQNNIPIVLFNVGEAGNVFKALTGDRVGTLIDQTGS